MRKGLTVALFTVAIAMMGFNAMSMAPTISGIKDVVVADDAPVSGGNHFVYPNAINLSSPSIVSDDVTSNTALIWSYLESTNTYQVNKVATLVGGDSTVAPPAAKRVAGPGATTTGDTPDDSDGNLYTATFRNIALSPYTGDGGEPGPAGIIAAQTKAMTLFASDGDLSSSRTIFVYTDNNGVDRLSPSGGVNIISWDFTGANKNGWVFVAGAGVTSSSTGGICLTAPLAGDNSGRWDSPYKVVDLVDNAVLEIRLNLTATATTAGTTPLWDLIIQNAAPPTAGPAGSIGANAYGGDYFWLDNIGGSQGIATPNGRQDRKIYYAPPALSMPNWRSTSTGAFQSAADPFNDYAFNFRILDNDSGGYGAQSDSGTICLTSMIIDRWDISNVVQVGAALFSDTNLTAANWYKIQTAAGANQTNMTFTGGVMNLAPASPGSSWTENIDVIAPGTLAAAGNIPVSTANFPLAWTANTALLLEVECSAPNAAAQQSQPDGVVPMIDAAGSETFQYGYTLGNIKFLGAGTAGAAAPPIAPSTGKYVTFAYTHNPSAASDFNRLRPRFDLRNFTAIQPQNPTGSINVHSIVVKKVNLQ
jgi:hypothetical protein